MLERVAALLTARGARAVLDAKGALRLHTAAGEALVKLVSPEELREQAFVVVEPIPGLSLATQAQTFELDGQLARIIPLDPALARSDDPLGCTGIDALYVHHRSIVMLRPPLDVDALARTHHTHVDTAKAHGHEAGASADLRPVVEFFFDSMRELVPSDPSRFRTGFVHEDLQSGNILHGPGGLHVIDLDPILSTYSVFNLAHFVAMEVVAKDYRSALFPLREHFLGVLVEESADDFDFFVMLAVFRALVRRAFHRDYYTEAWAEDLKWYYRELGLRRYLDRVRAQAHG